MPDFPSTIWTELDRARRGESDGWSAFVTRYRPPVVSFLRARGLGEADAEDLAQDVFLAFVRGDILEEVRRNRGRFRSLLLAVTCNLLRHWWRDGQAAKRGGGVRIVPLDGIDPPAPEDEEPFDRAWIGKMIATAMGELAARRPAHFRALTMSLEGRTQGEIATALRRTTAQVNNDAHRARVWVRGRIRELVRESCVGKEDADEELQHLGRYVDLG
jgi:RNA polymerase sigma-70 factor (ECF subfamily)